MEATNLIFKSRVTDNLVSGEKSAAYFMTREKISEVMARKSEELIVLAAAISPDFDVRVIHDFRVCFKYIRSFLRLIRMHNDDKGLKPSEKLKQLYHIAGSARDLQLEIIKMTEVQPEITDFLKDLEQSLHEVRKNWDRSYSDKALRRFAKQVRECKIDELPEGVLANFLNTHMESIDLNISVQNPTDVQMHNVRKHAKDILYASEVTDENWQAAKHQLERVPLKDLVIVAEKIGDYNDERQMLEHLVNYQPATEQEKQQMAQLKKQSGPRLTKQKKNIIKLVRNLFVKS